MRELLIIAAALLAQPLRAQTYPNPKLTPGVVDQAATVKDLCTPGYTAKIRLVTDATKRQVLASYGLAWESRGQYEIDHFISLELGGKNDAANLWPQRWSPKPGAREKDIVETWFHRQICAGKVTIRAAQDQIRTDWYAVYKKIKGRTK